MKKKKLSKLINRIKLLGVGCVVSESIYDIQAAVELKKVK